MQNSFSKFHTFSIFPSMTKNSGVCEGCIFDPQMFNVYINAVCDSGFNCNCVLLAEDFKFFHNIGHVKDCKLLQFHFGAVQLRFWENGRKLNVDKRTFKFFTRKTYGIYFSCKLCCTRVAY
jgi:hypothetical protein